MSMKSMQNVRRCVALMMVMFLAPAGRAAADRRQTNIVIGGGAYSEARLKQEVEGVVHEIELRRADEKAFGIARSHEAAEHAPPPQRGPDGRALFTWGAGQARVYCLVRDLCDVALEQGERVHDHAASNAADFVKHEVRGSRPHFIIQPLEPERKLTLHIYTDRRDYTIEFISTEDPAQHMPKTGFVYPEERQEERWREAMEEQGHVLRESAERGGYVIESDPEHLYFDYEVSDNCGFWWWKRCKWRPKRVYDDGEKTIVEMPEDMLVQEAPTVYVSVPGHKMAQVNFQLEGRFFIIQRLIERAYLVHGIGRHQERVKITRKDP
jgi:P-type conjugative transfer protein TrbG